MKTVLGFLKRYTAVFHLEWSTRCEYIRVPTTGSLMGTRWKEAPLDNPMQQHAVDTQMCPHLVGHWVQGICCARAYMHVVSNQMRVRSCTEISYMQFNCRCTHVIVLQKHTFNGQLVAVFSSLIFAGSFNFLWFSQTAPNCIFCRRENWLRVLWRGFIVFLSECIFAYFKPNR